MNTVPNGQISMIRSKTCGACGPIGMCLVRGLKEVRGRETGREGKVDRKLVRGRLKLKKEVEKKWCQLGCFFFIISPITVVRVQLKATNSEVLILASKEDKDK